MLRHSATRDVTCTFLYGDNILVPFHLRWKETVLKCEKFCNYLVQDCTIPVDTGRKLNVHKTFRTRPGRLLNVLCTFNLRPVSTGDILLSKLNCCLVCSNNFDTAH